MHYMIGWLLCFTIATTCSAMTKQQDGATVDYEASCEPSFRQGEIGAGVSWASNCMKAWHTCKCTCTFLEGNNAVSNITTSYDEYICRANLRCQILTQGPPPCCYTAQLECTTTPEWWNQRCSELMVKYRASSTCIDEPNVMIIGGPGSEVP